jgi:hypothetical protein
MAESTLRGSCLCGGVGYEISAPFVFFHHCHCSRCRKSSGSAFSANILVKAAQFRWTRGEELVRRWELPTAQHYCTGWCAACGSALPWQSRNGKGFLVPAGTLDDDPVARPDRNIFWASRAPWFTEPSSLPTVDEGK